jgi:hypothetical protein
MSAQHTPGPWSLGSSLTDGYHFKRIEATVNGKRRYIATVDIENDDANARLIAAAPDLLEALTNIFSGIETGLVRIDTDADEAWSNALGKARAAIAKATGGAA